MGAIVEDPKDTPRDSREKAKEARRESREAIREAAREVRDSRRESRRLTREQLGINFGRLTQQGLAIAGVAAESLLSKAGLREGDHVKSVNGQPVKSAEDFDRNLYKGDPAEDVKVTIFRDGKEEVLPLSPETLYVNPGANDLSYFGVTLDAKYPARLIIVKVLPNTPASEAGLRAGDEITSWNGKRVANSRDFVRIVQKREPGVVNFEYLRDSKPMRGQARFERSATEDSPQFPK
ncbi:MAG: PDZ domain-containing protein [Planctomycetes bacterium]|nr:PDZ domain-containing protein [Planctomycetota bacterium]